MIIAPEHRDDQWKRYLICRIISVCRSFDKDNEKSIVYTFTVYFMSRKIKQKIDIRFNSLVNNEKLEGYYKYSTENDFNSLHEYEA